MPPKASKKKSPKKATKPKAAKKAISKKSPKKAGKASGKKSAKKAAKPAGEKKPPGPYINFCAEQRPKLSDKLSFGEKGKELGARWKALSQAQKDKYKK